MGGAEGTAMARTALTQLQEQIEAVRREAYAAGYAAALQAVREFASRATLGAAEPAATARGRGRPRRAQPAQRRRGTARTASSPANPRPQRGTNARLIEEVLQAFAPRAARPTEIRHALQQEKGVSMAFTSIRHALGQLESRQAVEQLDGGKSWRYRAESPAKSA